MEVPGWIDSAALRLRQGHRVNRITVREFLGAFGAERRGSAKVEAIRGTLDSLGLTTDPDFATAWIDAPIWLRLKDGVRPTSPDLSGGDTPSAGDTESPGDFVLDATPSAVEQAEEQSQSAPMSGEPDTPKHIEAIGGTSFEDPTFRIGSLPAANRKLVVVNQGDSLIKAITLMLQYDFAQLPVMQSAREVKGVITWKSIGSKKALGQKCDNVGD